MRIQPDETYEQWVNRVTAFELANAKKDIANGISAEQALEDMSNRIMKKLMHPLLVAIREDASSNFDAEKSRASYFEKMQNRAPVADHVEEEKIDKQ